MQNAQEYIKQIAVPVLQATLQHQRERKLRYRYEPTVVYLLADRAKAMGVDLLTATGPWRAGSQTLRAPGRNGLSFIPFVESGPTRVMVDTPEQASVLAGLLNWCGVENLEPDSRPAQAGSTGDAGPTQTALTAPSPE
jgi:hypothetical protein